MDLKEALKSFVIFKHPSQKIETLKGNINEIPRRLTLLSTGSSSAVQLISNQLEPLIKQPMIIDAIYIHGENAHLPSAKANFFDNLRVGIARFFFILF